MKQLILTFCAMLLAVVIVFNIVGCEQIAAANLTEGLARETVSGRTPDEEFATAHMDFAISLFRETAKENGVENMLISPLSVAAALAMSANGAQGMTAEEMETVFGMDTERLNEYLYSYIDGLTDELSLANSVWFRDGVVTPKTEFLQTVKNYYNADVFASAFDEATVSEINAWVNENTHGMIEKIISEIDEKVLMYLVNALAFEAKWAVPYEEYQLEEGDFYSLDGGKQPVTLMWDNGYGTYFENENAVGFLKDYEGENYAFAAILPSRELDFSQYAKSLTAKELSFLLTNAREAKMRTAIPEFESAYNVELKTLLANMGMKTAFTETADFSNLADVDLMIDSVLHQTYISVDANGTKAAAVTIEMTIPNTESQMEEIILDRPFIYLILDRETNLPIFIGMVTDIE